MTTATQYDNPDAGCYVDESAGSAEDCCLRTIATAEAYGFTYEALPEEDSEDYYQVLSETADSAVDYLNDLETRTGLYWTTDDNSLFLLVDVESTKESVDFVSTEDQDYPPEDYRGEWLHISDHGNATLYYRHADAAGRVEDIEIWAIV